MPRIIVLTECRLAPHRRVILEERVVAAHIETDHSSAQLVERLGWATVDAGELEQAERDSQTQPGPLPGTGSGGTGELPDDAAA